MAPTAILVLLALTAPPEETEIAGSPLLGALAAATSGRFASSCQAPSALGLIAGATAGAAIAGGAGAFGTWWVNESADSDTRAGLTVLSLGVSGALGFLIGGALGAAAGMVVEVLLPAGTAERVIRVGRPGDPGATP